MKSTLCLLAAIFASSAWAGNEMSLSSCIVQNMKTNVLNVSTVVVHACEGMEADDSATLTLPQKSADGTNNLHSTLTTAVAHGLRVDVSGESKGPKQPGVLESVTLRSVFQR